MHKLHLVGAVTSFLPYVRILLRAFVADGKLVA